MTPKQIWEQDADSPIEVGQFRMFFIDGIGDVYGTVTKIDDDNCWFKVEDIEEEWSMSFDSPGMNFIGDLVKQEA